MAIACASIWNNLDGEIKSLSLRLFKQNLTKQVLMLNASLVFFFKLLSIALNETMLLLLLIFLFIFISFLFSLFFFIFSTTDLKHNNPCNCSSRLVCTILSSFFDYLSFINFFQHDILCTKQNKMVVVVVRAGKTLVEFFSLQY